MIRRLALLLLIGWPLTAAADSVQFKDYEIFFTTFRSTLIPADVAEAHGITRSESRIIVNVTVQKARKPVRATVDGLCTNLLNQLFTLGFVEVREETAIYYLASQIVDERDTLRYSINIQPEGEPAAYKLEFNRDFYRSSRQ